MEVGHAAKRMEEGGAGAPEVVEGPFPDLKAQDGKRHMYGGLGVVVGALVKLPVLIGAVLPFVVVHSAVMGLVKLVGLGPKSPKAAPLEAPEALLSEQEVAALPAPEAREFDLIIWGASGFTGGLAAKYLAAKYGTQIRWALAGRRKGALEKLRGELAKINADLGDLPLVLADASDDESLRDMCLRTKVVASSVGPFAVWGTALVRQCARTGTAYVDTTGEAAWARTLVYHFQDVAMQTGARIINFCGHDCIPPDLSVYLLAKTLQAESGQALKAVQLFQEVRGDASGGTVNTFIYHKTTYRPPRFEFNPMDLLRDGTRSRARVVDQVRVGPGYSSVHSSWYAWFYLSSVNRECIRRSNVLLDYNSSGAVTYKEQLVLPGFWAAVAWSINNAMLGAFILNSGLRWIITTLGLLPKAGTGPSEKTMEEGYLVMTAYGTGTGGAKASTQMYFDKDTLYKQTAAMYMESAMCLILDDDEALPSHDKGGHFSPCAAFGDTITKRLTETGVCRVQVRRNE